MSTGTIAIESTFTTAAKRGSATAATITFEEGVYFLFKKSDLIEDLKTIPDNNVWKLIEYKCLNDATFEFSHYMKLK